MENTLKHLNIYHSIELQQFIAYLEEKYRTETAKEKYHNLVNFSTNADVPYHQWFTYREGFSGKLIAELLSMSDACPDECIIDPFCGSGTTNVVAMLNGYNTLGLDVNPMSAYISNAKVDHYSESDIKELSSYLSDIHNYTQRNHKEYYKDIERYFTLTNYNELIRIKTFIDSLAESKAKRILNVAFNSIILDCSDRKRDGNGLKPRATKIVDVESHFISKVQLILSDIISVRPAKNASGFCVCNSANHLHEEYNKLFPNNTAGAIIFSPPYANSFDYFESYKLELVFGDYAKGIKGISELRKNAIRSFIGGVTQEMCDKYVDQIAKEIEQAVPLKEQETGKHDSRTRKVPNMIRGYFSDMQEVLRQCSSTLKSGKKTFIVVDQSAYCGIIVPTDLLLAYLGEIEGFKVGRIIECRKARTSTQQLNKYPYLKTTLRESIVELIKK